MMKQNVNGHSVDFIKRQAKTIAKEQNIPHHNALDNAAVAAGFNNWQHLVNTSKNSIEHDSGTTTINHIPDVKTWQHSKKINPHRNLLVAAVNELLTNNLISLDENAAQDDKGFHFCTIFNFPSVVMWQDISFGELRISVWWNYDHSKHPQANLTGNSRENFNCTSPLAKRSQYKEFVGVTATGWLERQTGKFLQGKDRRAIFDIYTRSTEKEILANLPVQQPNGFEVDGKFHF
jgi:hypothetical protein